MENRLYLEWYYVIYLVALALGGLSSVGASLDASFDGDATTDADSVPEEGFFSGVWMLLGFGRLPLALSFTVLTIIFGATGFATNSALKVNTLTPTFVSGLILLGSAVAALSVHALAAKSLSGLFSIQTAVVDDTSFLGVVGTLVTSLPTPTTVGLANFRVKGDLFSCAVRLVEGAPLTEAGASVRIVGRLSTTTVYLVEPVAPSLAA